VWATSKATSRSWRASGPTSRQNSPPTPSPPRWSSSSATTATAARRVLDFLLALPTRYPAQRHVFLCGNHDLAFAAFVGALPPPPDGSPFSATWDEYIHNEEHEGWFRGPGYEGMHVQGRRWGGVIKERWNPKKGLPYKGSIYDAQPTFESYGVAHGSPGQS